MNAAEFGYDLTGKVALVTGSSRGIGKAIALGLAKCGASVAIHYVGHQEEADAVALQIPKSCTVRCDLLVDDAPRKILSEVESKLGPVDILVLNASMQFRQDWDQVTREKFEQQVIANFRSEFEMIQLAAKHMIQQKWGRILTIGSVQQHRPHSAMIPYAATKSALETMVRALAKEFAPHNVTINNLAPGVILTDRNTDALSNEAYRQKVMSMIPLGRGGEADECVPPALMLCSDAGSYITGIDLVVDGGMRLP
ncbi:MAG: short-chain dehydrogenase [Phycisphaeraceae bacterium]|nr:short-chain dehydrogenase [Phycisphaeraceae bacterium]